MARRKRRLRRWLGPAVLVVIALLYYKPVRSYVETSHVLAARRHEVAELRRERTRLQRRLRASQGDAALEREARRLGFVRPGERLFIVKGIGAWERSRNTLRASSRRPSSRR